jgi:hypothetical protein
MLSEESQIEQEVVLPKALQAIIIINTKYLLVSTAGDYR